MIDQVSQPGGGAEAHTIDDKDSLRSLRNEAGRQREFFERRGQRAIADSWSKMERIAHEALTCNGGILLIVSE